jgi:hypothetical protein
MTVRSCEEGGGYERRRFECVESVGTQIKEYIMDFLSCGAEAEEQTTADFAHAKRTLV